MLGSLVTAAVERSRSWWSVIAKGNLLQPSSAMEMRPLPRRIIEIGGSLLLTLAVALLLLLTGSSATKAVSIAIGVLLFALLLVFLNELRYQRRQASARPAPEGGPEAGTSRGGDEFKVTLEEERVHQFQFKALIVERRIRIDNLTDHEKVVQGIGKRWDGRRNPPTLVDPTTDTDVWRETVRLEETHIPWPSRVEAHDHILAWVVVAFPQQPLGGIPEYRVSVKDERGDEYGQEQPARPKKTIIGKAG
jgi:hypothetical protein